MKAKISQAKRNNQKKNKLKKQGKLKNKKQKQKQINIQRAEIQKKVYSDEEEESDHGEDMLTMVDKDDLKFLKTSIVNRSYSLLKKIRVNNAEEEKQPRKRKKEVADVSEDEGIEVNYEETNTQKSSGNKKLKMMLPLKTKHGLIEQTMEVEDEPEEEYYEPAPTQVVEEEGSDMELFDVEDAEEVDKTKPLSTIELIAIRKKAMTQTKEKVGVICSGMLEDPEGKINNMRLLFNLMDHAKPEVYISTKKLVITSLLEIFKDLLPDYPIREQDTKETKMKKDTLKLVRYEEKMLQVYKGYLQRLEKIVMILTPKKGNTTKRTPQEFKLAETAAFCMCELLITHPNFNFSKNIVQVIIPLLNHRLPNIREMICTAIKRIFKDDKKGETTLIIMRKINLLVKNKAASLHTEVLDPFLSLKIKGVNLDKEKEQELKEKKLQSRKQNVLSLSKKERKRKKKLEELNKELLETQAEESKTAKQKLQTEIVQILFTIYFRILKQYPNSKILSITLEGLAKFAHSINLDYYTDLVNVLNHLLEESQLGYREQLHCVLTVMSILSGQGDVLNIDPLHFYTHLYKNLFQFHAGIGHKDFNILIETLDLVLVKRRKKLSHKRFVAFAKRLGTLTLHSLNNSALASLGLIKTLLQLVKSLDILLCTDQSCGDGAYLPFNDNPEYANAYNSALWEMTILGRHYHPIVRKMGQHIATGVPATGNGCLPVDLKKLGPLEWFNEYDSTSMAFKPAITPPKSTAPATKVEFNGFVNYEFENYCREIQNRKIGMNYFDISGKKLLK